MADAMILPPELCDTQEGEPEWVTSYLKRSHELIPPRPEPFLQGSRQRIRPGSKPAEVGHTYPGR
jgi:hypothetical protein